jgi:hydrogenase expression/formation protein HypC
MCLAIPGQVIEFVDKDNFIAKVDVSGVRRNVNVGLILPDGLQTGDWVLIHVGFALSKIDEKEAEETFRYLEGLGQAYADELEGLSASQIE